MCRGKNEGDGTKGLTSNPEQLSFPDADKSELVRSMSTSVGTKKFRWSTDKVLLFTRETFPPRYFDQRNKNDR
jgi:hypothetical protein